MIEVQFWGAPCSKFPALKPASFSTSLPKLSAQELTVLLTASGNFHHLVSRVHPHVSPLTNQTRLTAFAASMGHTNDTNGKKPSLDALSASLLTARRNADLLLSSASQSTPIRCVRRRRIALLCLDTQGPEAYLAFRSWTWPPSCKSLKLIDCCQARLVAPHQMQFPSKLLPSRGIQT